MAFRNGFRRRNRDALLLIVYFLPIFQTEAETEAIPEEETVEPELASLTTELIDAVSNEDEIYFASDDDSEMQGYGDISMDATHIFIYSDAELTDEIGGFDWEYDEESDTMIIMDTVAMAQTDADSL